MTPTTLNDEIVNTELPVAVEMPTEQPAAPVVNVPVEAPVTPPAPVEQTYVYQPTDEQGRFLGGKQVIKYHTIDELTSKLTEQNVLLVRKLRETTKKQRLGIAEGDAIPDNAPRFDMPVDFTPRVMSAAEREALSRDLLDPEKFNDATEKLFEAAVGAKPVVLSETLTRLQHDNLKLLARAEGDAFVSATPGYFPCRDNFEVMTNWMFKNKLAPVQSNYLLAYDTLKAAGLLLDAPIVREEPSAVPPSEAVTPSQPTSVPAAEPTPANSQPVQEIPSRITTDEPAQVRRPAPLVATGLTRNQATDAGSPPAAPFTLKQINAMDSETYRRNLRNPAFAKLVERLEREAAEARNRS